MKQSNTRRSLARAGVVFAGTAAAAFTFSSSTSYGADPVTFVATVPAIAQTLGFHSYQGNPTRDVLAEPASTLVMPDIAGLADGGCRTVNSTKLTGNLASSWTINSDSTEITFTLKDGKSEWGNELSAEDVKYTILTSIKNVPVVGTSLTNTANLAEPYVTVIDAKHVKIHVKPGGYNPMTLGTFARFEMGIQDSKEVAKHVTPSDPYADTWLQTNNAFFGPWKLESFTPGQQVTYVKNPGYLGKRGNVDKLVIRAVPDASTRAGLLSRGEIQSAASLSFGQYKQLQDKSQVLTCVSGNQEQLTMNFDFKPLADVRVRQAISLAVDRALLVKIAHEGFDRPSQYGLPAVFIDQLPADAKAQVQKYKFDPAEAKRLLKEAGYGDGFTVEFLASNARPGPYGQAQATLISSQLKDVGIDAKIVLLNGAEFADRWFKKNFQMILYSQVPTVIDPYYVGSSYLHTGAVSYVYNYSKPDVLDAAVDALRHPNPAAMVALSNMITTDYPMAYIVDADNVIALTKNVSGFEYRGTPLLYVDAMTLK